MNFVEVASVPEQITLIINILFVAEILFQRNKHSYVFAYILLYGEENKKGKAPFLT